MIGWLIFALILLLVLLLPCGVCAGYGSNGVEAKLIIGPISVKLIPTGKKTPKKQNEKKKKFETHERVKEKGRLTDFIPIAKLIFAFLSDFRRRMVIRDFRLKMILGGGDPYSISVNYGHYWAVLGNCMPHLESWFTIKNRNLEIECDYLASDTKVEASIDVRISVFTLLHMVLRHGIRILIKYYEISKQTKDGAVS